MNQSKFQPEPAGAAIGTRDLTQHDRWGTANNSGIAALSTLILTLRTNRPLTATHHETLDGLGAFGTNTFLVRDGAFVSPVGQPLFDIELIAGSINQCGDAIYSHRCRPMPANGIACQIHSAVINTFEENPIIIGLYGPEPELSDPVLENRFCTMVAQVRRIYKSISQTSDEINRRLASEMPVVIVNRSSGRIAAMNNSIARLLRTREEIWLDREYGSIHESLCDALPQAEIRMDNFSGGELHLTAVTLVQRRPRASAVNVESSLLSRARDKIASIASATNLLETIAGDENDNENLDLCISISTETGKLHLYITALGIINDYSALTKQKLRLADQLRQAMETGNFAPSGDKMAPMFQSSESAFITAPPSAIQLMLTSLLGWHDRANPEKDATSIQLELSIDRSAAEISVTTRVSEPNHHPDEWRLAVVQRLANLSGAKLKQNFSASDKMLTTQIIFEDLQ